MLTNQKDIGAYLASLAGPVGVDATAGGSGDATAATGPIHDRQSGVQYPSGLLAIVYTATLAQDETLSLTAKIEHGDESNLSDAAEYTFGGAEVDFGVVATGDTGGSTEIGTADMRVDLTGLKRYWRVSVTPDLSATGTDTAELSAVVVCGGQGLPTSD